MDNFRRLLITNRKKTALNSIVSAPEGSFSSSKKIDASLTPFQIAEEKLKKLSITFDSDAVHTHLQSYAGMKLALKDFIVMLRQSLNMSLTSAEYSDLFQHFLRDENDCIRGIDFIRYFVILGTEGTYIH